MNAILLALVFTAIILLDYVWIFFEDKLKQRKYAAALKWSVIIILLVAGWSQAIVQYRKDVQSDKDMDFLKNQLSQANQALTNSTAVVKGLTTGGDYLPDVLSGIGERTNTLSFTLLSQSDFPLRDLHVKLVDETLRIKNGLDKPTSGRTLYDQFFGDYPAKGTTELCTIPLDLGGTNFIRIDVHTLTGMYWEIIDVFHTNNTWASKLHYRWTQSGGKGAQIDPPEMKGAILVY